MNQRIASLRESIKKGLYRQNLDELAGHCDALAQDTPYLVTFFVLKHLFSELSSALDGPLEFKAHEDLTSGIAAAANLILDKVANDQRIEADELESILRTHIRNMNVFRSAPQG